MAVKGVVAPRIMAKFFDSQPRLVRVGGFEPELVDREIRDSLTKEKKQTKVMRVYLSEVDGEVGWWEWNIHSKRLMVVMNEILARKDWKDLTLSVVMRGTPPYTAWDVRVL